MRGRGGLVALAVAAVVVVLLVAIGAPDDRSDRRFDPSSPGPNGAKGVVLLLEELGADVTVAGDELDDDVATALVLEDRLDDDGADELDDWVRDGGVLVVADQSSELFGFAADGRCPVALDQVGELAIDPGSGATVDRGDGCFDGIVSIDERGSGSVVSVSRRFLFTNQLLGEADNAVLAAALLAPTGSERVAFVAGSSGSGEQSLGDLLGPRAAQAIVQLAVAFLLYALWRGRRLGRAVVEPQPVAIAGSELVAAVGRLQEGRRRPAEVADTVRKDVLRAIERRLGVPAGADISGLAETVAAQCGLPPDRVLRALSSGFVTTDDELLDVLADLDRIRSGVLAPRAPVASQPGGT